MQIYSIRMDDVHVELRHLRYYDEVFAVHLFNEGFVAVASIPKARPAMNVFDPVNHDMRHACTLRTTEHRLARRFAGTE